MSKKKKLSLEEYKKRRDYLMKIAAKYKWDFSGGDASTFRASFTDELSVFKIDVYLSRNTLCLLPKGDAPKYFRQQTWEQIENIFKNPFNKSFNN